MTIKITMNTLTLSCCTHKEFRAPPTSCMGWASAHINRVRKLLFYAVLWQLTARDRRFAVASNQVGKPGLLVAWNGGKLKSDKKSHFV